jgi:hypothetical protein
MPMTPAAAKKYKPRRTPESLDEVIYPETRAKMQEAKTEAADTKETAKNEADYNKSLTTENKAKGGMVSASSRADGCATKGKTRGKMV